MREAVAGAGRRAVGGGVSACGQGRVGRISFLSSPSSSYFPPTFSFYSLQVNQIKSTQEKRGEKRCLQPLAIPIAEGKEEKRDRLSFAHRQGTHA
jgi:hypothetical protein